MIIKFLNKIVTNLLIFTIRLYQLTLSPFLKPNCRYLPSCSEYSIAALKEHGLIVGLFVTQMMIAGVIYLGYLHYFKKLKITNENKKF